MAATGEMNDIFEDDQHLKNKGNDAGPKGDVRDAAEKALMRHQADHRRRGNDQAAEEQASPANLFAVTKGR